MAIHSTYTLELARDTPLSGGKKRGGERGREREKKENPNVLIEVIKTRDPSPLTIPECYILCKSAFGISFDSCREYLGD